MSDFVNMTQIRLLDDKITLTLGCSKPKSMLIVEAHKMGQEILLADY